MSHRRYVLFCTLAALCGPLCLLLPGHSQGVSGDDLPLSVPAWAMPKYPAPTPKTVQIDGIDYTVPGRLFPSPLLSRRATAAANQKHRSGASLLVCVRGRRLAMFFGGDGIFSYDAATHAAAIAELNWWRRIARKQRVETTLKRGRDFTAFFTSSVTLTTDLQPPKGGKHEH